MASPDLRTSYEGFTRYIDSSNGYARILVGRGHPLANVKGWAYEHRLIASAKVGSWVARSQKVHHVNRDRSDNRPENLEVYGSQAEHLVKHRSPRSRRRKPGEGNPAISCSCGCGETLTRFDQFGNPRSCVFAHGIIPSAVAEAVLNAIGDGEKTVGQIREEVGGTKQMNYSRLNRLKKIGLVVNVRRGTWRRTGQPHLRKTFAGNIVTH
jgi:hypothetical protein